MVCTVIEAQIKVHYGTFANGLLQQGLIYTHLHFTTVVMACKTRATAVLVFSITATNSHFLNIPTWHLGIGGLYGQRQVYTHVFSPLVYGLFMFSISKLQTHLKKTIYASYSKLSEELKNNITI